MARKDAELQKHLQQARRSYVRRGRAQDFDEAEAVAAAKRGDPAPLAQVLVTYGGFKTEAALGLAAQRLRGESPVGRGENTDDRWPTFVKSVVQAEMNRPPMEGRPAPTKTQARQRAAEKLGLTENQVREIESGRAARRRGQRDGRG